MDASLETLELNESVDETTDVCDEKNHEVGYRDILKQKEFMKEILSLIVNRFGDAVDAIASSWIVYELTGNAAWSAIIYAMNTLPTVFITPFAGAFVENKNKKLVIVISDFIRALCVGYIATAYLMGFLQGWHLIITTLIISTVEAFSTPASTAITPQILDKEYYDYGLSLEGSVSTVVELIGIGAAAGIIAFLGTGGAIYIDMATFIIAGLIYLTIKTKKVKNEDASFNSKEYIETLKEGFKYAVNKKVVLFICIVACFLNGILVPINSLQAPFISEVLGAGAGALSVIGICVTGSMIVGSILYPIIRKHVSGRGIIICGGVAIALFYLGLIAFKPLYSNVYIMYTVLAIVTILLGGACAIASSFASVEFLKIVDEEYLSRAGAIFAALTVAMNPVISLILSFLSSFLSVAVIFAIAGVIAVIASVFLAMSKSLKELD